MSELKIDISQALSFVDNTAYQKVVEEVKQKHEQLLNGTGKGNDFLGWRDLPAAEQSELLIRIKKAAAELASHSKFVVVIGIGGSYLGSKAVIDALSNPFSAFLPGRTHPVVIFAGHNMCEEYHKDLLEFLSKVDYSVIVISKSGTTTEPAIAYRLIKAQMEIRYGKEEASLRTVAITDATKGDLKEMADKEKITQFIIPDDVGGRFSVLTPVGLLPIAAAGFNIDQLMKGANDMRNLLVSTNHPDQNPAIIYAAIRNALLHQGKTIELLVNYTPRLQNLIEWWKQLYGESEGKEGKGIFPAGANFTTDLHSMGQYIQDGQRMLFETVISVEQEDPSSTNPQDAHLTIPDPEMKKENAEDLFGGKTMAKINLVAEEATCEAHVEGGVPNIRIHFHPINEYNLGKLIYFFEFACALSGYTLDVNPFDQPGVEAYKKKMFKRLE